MIHVLKSLIIAFSIYSKIPVPQFDWKEEDMRYILIFFPWVGAFIGVLIYLWNCLCNIMNIGDIAYVMIGSVIPLLITGGFHADGFIDTMDAFHSYQPREKKLEILKDSHIGAFAVIMFAVYGMIYIGAFSEIKDERLLKIVCGEFFLSRCLSGISVVSFTSAKKEGTLYLFASSSQKKVVKWLLYMQSIACIFFMLSQSIYLGLIVVAAALLTFLYYYYRTKKELGGITGDTAGYFILISELSMLVAAAVTNIFLR